MKKVIAGLSLLLMPFLILADEEESSNSITRTLTIEKGKLVREQQEIEIYDYHTGTYQTVNVYREKKPPSSPAESGPPKAGPNGPQTK